MPQEKGEKLLCVDDLRHAEYYAMQECFDNLYQQSKNGELFTNLMPLILTRENILLAYRNIKANTGSNTAGTDRLTIKDIGKRTPDEVVKMVQYIVTGSPHGYRPRAVRRKEIPKPNGSTRPLGIPCIWDRLVQQCIKQVMEPICEAHFSENSFGFRPNHSVENAIQRTYCLLQRSHMHYVIEFDIKGFFDNVDHSKLIRQIWAMGIRDKHLLYVIRQILKAPIRMPDGKTIIPDKGTPQGGIISPLLANIVLNELDHWIESQWQENPVIQNYVVRVNHSGCQIKSHGYRAMRTTRLKEMYIVRYADDFRIFCNKRSDAEKTKIAITQWLKERLRLDVSPEKTRIVNVKRQYTEFLGFKIRLYPKGNKHVVRSHICDKKKAIEREKLITQAKKIQHAGKDRKTIDEVRLYNSMVMGIQNAYAIATDISLDCSDFNRAVMTVLTNRLNRGKSIRLVKKGRKLTETERERYGKSKMMRFDATSDEPIYPIGYIRNRKPMARKMGTCSYTAEGRIGLHDNLRINIAMMHALMREPLFGRSTEYADNRISLFSAQWGKCAVTGIPFSSLKDIHCHHITPVSSGGTDRYSNLVLIHDAVHKLIHAKDKETIQKYMEKLNLKKTHLKKVNNYRMKSGLPEIQA